MHLYVYSTSSLFICTAPESKLSIIQLFSMSVWCAITARWGMMLSGAMHFFGSALHLGMSGAGGFYREEREYSLIRQARIALPSLLFFPLSLYQLLLLHVP